MGAGKPNFAQEALNICYSVTTQALAPLVPCDSTAKILRNRFKSIKPQVSWCVSLVLLRYFHLATFFWMFVEGKYFCSSSLIS